MVLSQSVPFFKYLKFQQQKTTKKEFRDTQHKRQDRLFVSVFFFSLSFFIPFLSSFSSSLSSCFIVWFSVFCFCFCFFFFQNLPAECSTLTLLESRCDPLDSPTHRTLAKNRQRNRVHNKPISLDEKKKKDLHDDLLNLDKKASGFKKIIIKISFFKNVSKSKEQVIHGDLATGHPGSRCVTQFMYCTVLFSCWMRIEIVTKQYIMTQFMYCTSCSFPCLSDGVLTKYCQ